MAVHLPGKKAKLYDGRMEGGRGIWRSWWASLVPSFKNKGAGRQSARLSPQRKRTEATAVLHTCTFTFVPLEMLKVGSHPGRRPGKDQDDSGVPQADLDYGTR